ncbi:hypothetical protein CA265_11295 [Sphingobacteriaceae bacterium GW460-11-11-14-LB5]|nr:hypothetical protein CA265_11295 [Sphingobacteriaceae bacterium GW460-11-11-14-LB5]
MNILNIIEEIEKVEGEVYNELSPRRKALQHLLNVGKKVSLAALPLTFGSMFQKAYSQTTTNAATIDSLNLVLVLGYMQFQFYNNALTATPTLILVADKPIITTLRDQEQAHINVITKAVTDLGGTPRPLMPYTSFDYTKVNANVATNYGTFLRTAVVLEDLSERAYKGQLITLMGTPALATAARIQTVEARHSAQLRQMVNKLQIATLKYLRPWVSIRRNDADGSDLLPITGNDSMIGALNPVYDIDAGLLNRETKTAQAGIELLGIAGNVDLTAGSASEAFDEYLLTATVKTAANLFIKTGFQLI